LIKRDFSNLTADQIEQFEIYYKELVLWNKRINLTRITDYRDVQLKHFADSVTPLDVINLQTCGNLKCIDVGSGAGFPGLPLKILVPGINLCLVESVGKKVNFLEHIVKRLSLDGVTIYNNRAEVLGRDSMFRETFDLILARALGPMNVVAELTLPFSRIGGKVILFKKGEISREIEDSHGAIIKLGGRLAGSHPTQISGLEDNRTLVILDKVSHTPDIYPRKAGIPKKRPLT
tara:strand:+ start:679 stop:1377 length:699 start_codon:yes stop_codon:yes gene_type:complete